MTGEHNPPAPHGGDIAVIGMSCVFPGAKDVAQYWDNILNKVDAVSEAPPDWEPEFYHDPDGVSNDRTYCIRGGFLRELASFDPAEYGVMPNSVDGSEPDHFLALRAARQALVDAGYSKIGEFRQRTAVIIGRGTYVNRGNANALQHVVMVDSVIRVLRQLHPEYTDDELAEIKKRLKESLPPFSAETAAGLVPNIISGRIANRLDLMGPNYIVDAACASSLVAIDHGIRDLQSRRCDMAVVGGVNASVPPVIMSIFSQLKALSSSGVIRPFDADADGTLLGEGVGMIVLKRVEDAEADGNAIYAVLKGVGLASDGRAIGLLAPRLEGEELALKRAYGIAGVDPATVGLIEAHGTATLVGDAVEVEALRNVLGTKNGDTPRCAIGSVKSMISHTMPAAGVAGLIKVVCALQHKVLPPTLHCEHPNSKLGLGESNFYLNSATRPWIHGSTVAPRRAGVNAFGFGGINAHAVVEEYQGPNQAPHLQRRWDSELFLVSAASSELLAAETERVERFVASLPENTALKDLAWTLNCDRELRSSRLAVVASSRAELIEKLNRATARLRKPGVDRIRTKDGIYFFREPLTRQGGKLAFIFPGEGAQYVNMLSDLCIHFPEVREWFDLMDRAFEKHTRGYLLSQCVYPPPGSAGDDRLWTMDIGAEAVFCATQGVHSLLESLGVRPDAVVGHSSGEHSSLIASGIVRTENEAEMVEHILGVNEVFEALDRDNRIPQGVLLTIAGAGREDLESLIAQDADSLFVALDNCPHQLVLFGSEKSVQDVVDALTGKPVICQRLPFGRAYHTPWFKEFAAGLHNHFERIRTAPPNVPIYSCVTTERFPEDLPEIRKLIAKQWASTVRFRETVETMYRDGIRIFVEVGPRGNLTSFVDDILRGRSYIAVPANLQHRSGIQQLHHLLGQLLAQGVAVNLARLYEHRDPQLVSANKSPSKPEPVLSMGLQPMRLPPDFRLPSKQPLRETAPAGAPTPPERAKPRRVAVVERHLSTMQQFLATQQEVMSAYLGRRGNGPLADTGSAIQRPFVTEMVEIVPGTKARARYRFRPDRDRLFLDHTLGREISETDISLTGLGVVPLTITMEILAEGAAALMPGKVLIGMREVRASQWITLESEDLTLEIQARALDQEGAVQVSVREIGAGSVQPVSAEGIMLFAERYPPAPAASPTQLEGLRESAWKTEQLYRDGMFHGPAFRAVKTMDSRATNGCVATLVVPPRELLFAAEPAPDFLSDPVILDAAGQVVAFWYQECLQPKGDIFPYRLAALDCYQPPPPAGAALECRVLCKHVDDRVIHSDIEIVDHSGRLHYRLENWEDRRFLLPQKLRDLRTDPRQTYLADRWDAPLTGVPTRNSVICCRVGGFDEGLFGASHGIWLKMLAHLVLSRRERELFSNPRLTDSRRRDWLLGRCAAKDAVRLLLKEARGIELLSADVEILPDGRGRPIVDGAFVDKLGVAPAVSISHSVGTAVALASLSSGNHLGIDIECPLRTLGEADGIAFTQEERRLLDGLDRDRQEWLLRLWCAKEAAAKAIGCGFSSGLHSLQVAGLNRETGLVHLKPERGLTEEFPALEGKTLTAHTSRFPDLICSTVL